MLLRCRPESKLTFVIRAKSPGNTLCHVVPTSTRFC
jgi:hypothetical protein